MKQITRVALFNHHIKFIILLVCFALVIVFNLSNLLHTSSPIQKPNDIKTILQNIASPAFAASSDFFLKIDGIPGESVDPQHQDQIDLLSWSWGSSQVAPTGKVNFQDFLFTMNVSKASPKLFVTCASGKTIKDAILSVRSTKGPQVDFLKITFTDLACNSFNEKGDPQNIIPIDQVILNFTKITIEYTQLGADGKPVAPPITESWSFK